jgi:fumarate hydratase class I
MSQEFIYEDMFPTGDDPTEYRLITKDHVSTGMFEGMETVRVEPEALAILTEHAFRDVSHLLRNSHLKQIADILKDPEASANDRYMAMELLKNAVISADGVFPICQDTGTAIVIGRKGQIVQTGYSDEEAISRGVFNAYTKNNFRYSQNAALNMFSEKNTRCNLPAQIELYTCEGDSYEFLFIAKGGGSSNKTSLYQETAAILNPEDLTAFMTEKMKGLGTGACPPYHIAFVVGGTSPEANLRTVKLATAGYLDNLPESGNEQGRAFRDKDMEGRLLKASQGFGTGAQFGGKYFCLDVRVVRLPRHGASCLIGMGVSCVAHRNIRGKITWEGIFLEKLETNPARFMPESAKMEKDAVHIDLSQPMEKIRAVLTRYPVSTRLSLTGKMVVARDIAHARLKARLIRGEGLPQYLKDYVICYAGPAKTPDGYASGSFGPTTAERMDPYVPLFQGHGASLITLAKGNRSAEVKDSCRRHGGFYLGTIGGTAAVFGKECVTKVEVIDYFELGMEAVFMITVKDFPAFIIIDDKGNDFYEILLHPNP